MIAMKTVRAVALSTLAAIVTCCVSLDRPPTPVATAAPSPTISCDDLEPADCAAALEAALAVSTGDDAPPTSILMGSGIWWPSAGSICNDSSCPTWESASPDGGKWIGHALVNYPDSTARAFINISKHGDAVSAILVALAMPAPGPSDPGPS